MSALLGTKRKEGPELSWSVKFEDASTLRTIVETAHNVVSRVTFKIVRDGDAFCLKIDTADVAVVSLLSVRYFLDVVTLPKEEEEDITFCVDCRHMIACLANMRTEYSLIMEGFEDQLNPKVRIRARDADAPSHETCTELDTFVDSDIVQLSPMDFDIMIEVDLVMFRGLIKQAQVAKAEQISIDIYTKKSAGGDTISYTCFSAQGDFKHTASFFHEVSRDVDGSMIVRAATDSSQEGLDVNIMDFVYSGMFPTEKIAGFIKPLQCRMIVAKVMQDKPIMFEYRIGGVANDGSHIRYLIAPTTPNID